MKIIPVRKILASPNTPANAGRFSIRQIEGVLDGKDLVHDLHKHDFYFVLAVQSGSGVHEIDFIQYPVSANNIFVLRPGQVHRLELTANSSGYLMEFAPSFYQPVNTITEHRWKKAVSKNFCEIEALRFGSLGSLLASIYNEFTARQDGFNEAIKAYLDLFFIEYVRQSHHPDALVKKENQYAQDRFEEFIQLLETNISKMKTVSEYADRLNLSSYQLNSITKSSVGKTVSDLINEQIILEAKRYLLATPNQIKDIADHLGYEDVSYFIRFFKKQTGSSPDLFRKNFK